MNSNSLPQRVIFNFRADAVITRLVASPKVSSKRRTSIRYSNWIRQTSVNPKQRSHISTLQYWANVAYLAALVLIGPGRVHTAENAKKNTLISARWCMADRMTTEHTGRLNHHHIRITLALKLLKKLELGVEVSRNAMFKKVLSWIPRAVKL